jgi:Protein of unknown function (DUF3800)
VAKKDAPYSHFSSMLERTGDDWLIAMLDFEVYFDDSGTHSESEIAVASCYIAPRNQWDSFVRNLDEAREKHGFDCFHMADFMARQKEFIQWDDRKGARALESVSCIIKTRITVGFSCAVPKKSWDQYMPDRYKAVVGGRHYTFAVRSVMGIIEQWRKKFAYTQPMQYVFDRMSQGKGEIMAVMDTAIRHPKDCLEKYGAVKDGYSFQDKRAFKPLQAADMLAWETYNHMRTVVIPNSSSLGTANFRYLRDKPSKVVTSWLTDAQVKKMADNMIAREAETGLMPFWTEGDSPISEEGHGMI